MSPVDVLLVALAGFGAMSLLRLVELQWEHVRHRRWRLERERAYEAYQAETARRHEVAMQLEADLFDKEAQ